MLHRMTAPYLTRRDVILALEALEKIHGNQRNLARVLGVHETYLSRIKNGGRVGPKVARALRLRPVVVYAEEAK